MPAQKPGRSIQSYGTPPDFLRALKRALGISSFSVDLAADEKNAVADRFYTADMDSLNQSWDTDGRWAYCNPPFGHILPWVHKAYTERLQNNARVAMLLPASVGSNWWRDWVHDKCRVWFLNRRLTFVGQTDPYPKDCAILLYSRYLNPGYHCWDWMNDDLRIADP